MKLGKAKNWLTALVIIMPLIAVAQNVGINQSGAMPSASAMLDLSNTFSAYNLTDSQLAEFEERGVQKLNDFYNYLTIISNPAYDIKMREEAKNQAKQLFYGSDCSVDGITYSDFIDSCFNLKGAVDWKAEGVIISERMKTKADAKDTVVIYAGELSFKELVDSKVSGSKRAGIILSMTVKQFGNTQREIWTVYLCTID
jgi:hypothetical protein